MENTVPHIEDVTEAGIILSHGATIPWEDVRVVGKRRSYRWPFDGRNFRSAHAAPKYTEYYVNNHSGKTIGRLCFTMFADYDSAKKDFFARAEKLLQLASQRHQIVYEEFLGRDKKELDVSEQIRWLAYQQTDEATHRNARRRLWESLVGGAVLFLVGGCIILGVLNLLGVK